MLSNASIDGTNYTTIRNNNSNVNINNNLDSGINNTNLENVTQHALFFKKQQQLQIQPPNNQSTALKTHSNNITSNHNFNRKGNDRTKENEHMTYVPSLSHHLQQQKPSSSHYHANNNTNINELKNRKQQKLHPN